MKVKRLEPATSKDRATSATKVSTKEAPPTSSVWQPSSKIRDRHWQRLAVVYIRQSSPHQVLENRESRERQYALVQVAQQFGWPADRVLVIDEDQGLSGKLSENRNGFQRVLTEVALDHVGLVLGLELSRLARSCKDWHHLMEVCAVFDTLLYDQDGVYDANDSNDRLLLGMKGAMSEYELITLRNRLERGRDNLGAISGESAAPQREPFVSRSSRRSSRREGIAQRLGCLRPLWASHERRLSTRAKEETALLVRHSLLRGT